MKLSSLTVRYGSKTVFNNFDIEFPDGKITCVLGASGSGKTTLLKVIADTIPFQGRVENAPEKCSYVFQDPTLIPSLTVEKNLDLILKSQIKDKKLRKKTISDILCDVGLSAENMSYPASLSGGMAQRVSLARAFSYPADCLLMDEPFKGLDVTLKKQMISLFLKLYDKKERTAIFVTHDIDEALLLGDKIIVLDTATHSLNEFFIDKPREERTLSELSGLKEDIYKLL